jgi:hypothetical protein
VEAGKIKATWEQQRSRLPSHKYRRLQLNLPGLPEGSAFSFEKIDAAVERNVKVRPPQPGIDYSAFVDMSGGSNDDSTLPIAHRDPDGRAVLDLVINQGRSTPFDPIAAVDSFARTLKEYRCSHVIGDRFAGETFRSAFEKAGVSYTVSELTRSQHYEPLEPKLNSGQVALLDNEMMESQFLGLVWRGSKIDHPANEHDDYANAAAGAINLVSVATIDVSQIRLLGRRLITRVGSWDRFDDGLHPMDRLLDCARSGKTFWDD